MQAYRLQKSQANREAYILAKLAVWHLFTIRNCVAHMSWVPHHIKHAKRHREIKSCYKQRFNPAPQIRLPTILDVYGVLDKEVFSKHDLLELCVIRDE
jgi:hypothetical protein